MSMGAGSPTGDDGPSRMASFINRLLFFYAFKMKGVFGFETTFVTKFWMHKSTQKGNY